jgi:tetratricopeptide (TPR) repeat protein
MTARFPSGNKIAPVWAAAAFSLQVYGSERGEVHLAGISLSSCARIRCSMVNRYTKGALICAMLPIGLFAAGCTTSSRHETNTAVSSNPGLGEDGFKAFQAGDYSEAKAEFASDYREHSESPLTQFNMGAAYRQEGDHSKANSMYSQAAAGGKEYRPSRFLEVNSTNATITEIACRHLHEDNQRDVSCNDRMAAAEPAPAPPAVEAAATVYTPPEPPPKQDRN